MIDISVKDYLSLPEIKRVQYEGVLKHLNPANALAGQSINAQAITYGTVKRCLRLIQKGKTAEDLERLYCLAFGIDPEAFYTAKVSEFFAAQNFVLNYFVNLQNKEAALLQSIDTDAALWEAAGGAKLNRFGPIMPLVQLGEIYGVWPFDLETRPYQEVLTLLAIHKERAEVSREYQRIKQSHAGHR